MQYFKVGNCFSILMEIFLSVSPISGMNAGLKESVRRSFETDTISFFVLRWKIRHLNVVSFNPGSNR
jgi:hypothetical protein